MNTDLNRHEAIKKHFEAGEDVYISFCVPTRCHFRPAVRKVKAITRIGDYEVGYNTWPDFLIHRDEVSGWSTNKDTLVNRLHRKTGRF